MSGHGHGAQQDRVDRHRCRAVRVGPRPGQQRAGTLRIGDTTAHRQDDVVVLADQVDEPFDCFCLGDVEFDGLLADVEVILMGAPPT